MKSFRFASRRAAGWLIAAFVLLTGFVPGAAAAATYYFSTSGNDANDGLTPATAKRSLEPVAGLLGPGTSVLLKRGDVWHAPELSWNFAGKAGASRAAMRIGAYGNASLPTPRIVALARIERSAWKIGRHGSLIAPPGTLRLLEHRMRVFAGGAMLRHVGGTGPLPPNSFRLIENEIEFRLGESGEAQELLARIIHEA